MPKCALGGQTDIQVVVNILAPYAIGKEFGHGEDKNITAKLVSHAILAHTAPSFLQKMNF
jgi:hypothetical protein